jgi:flagellar assembly factor FliW
MQIVCSQETQPEKRSNFADENVADREIIEFPEGLLGFEQFKRFVIVEREEYEPFQWLISIDDPNLGFVIIDPTYFYPSYDPKIDENELASILDNEGRTLLIYTIVTVSPDPGATSANLLAPVLLCVETWKAKQVVLNDPRYSTRHRVMGNKKNSKSGSGR